MYKHMQRKTQSTGTRSQTADRLQVRRQQKKRKRICTTRAANHVIHDDTLRNVRYRNSDGAHRR